MQPSRDRHARIDDSRRAPGAERRAPRRLRWAAALAVLALLALGGAPAQAGTGGAATAYGAAADEDLVFSPFRTAGASWYGPGLYGNETACGQILRATTIGVAHRSLPCGTAVKFVFEGRAVIAPVIDRGPFVKGRAWDLTAAASEALEFDGAGMVRYAIAVSYARARR